MRDTESKSDLNLVFLPKITWKIGKDEFQGNSSDKYLAYEFHLEEEWEIEKPPGHSIQATGVLQCGTLTQDHTVSQVPGGEPPEVLSKRPVIGSCVSRLERGRPGQIVHHPCKVRATGWKHCPRVLQIWYNSLPIYTHFFLHNPRHKRSHYSPINVSRGEKKEIEKR